MPAPLATTEPRQITAGDTVRWVRDLPFHSPADGWVVSIAINNAGASRTITGSDNSDGRHLITITPADSAALPAGDYRYQVAVTHATQGRVTVGHGEIKVLANLDGAAADTRSRAKTLLDAIDASLLGRATNDQQRMTINGRTIERTAIADLIALRDRYQHIYNREQAAEQLANGRPSRRKLMTRFND